MCQETDVWTLKKYLLYDFAREALADSKLFTDFHDAVAAAGGRRKLIVVAVDLQPAPSPDHCPV